MSRLEEPRKNEILCGSCEAVLLVHTMSDGSGAAMVLRAGHSALRREVLEEEARTIEAMSDLADYRDIAVAVRALGEGGQDGV